MYLYLLLSSPKVKDAVGTTVLVMMDTVLVHSDTVVNTARTVSGCFCGRYFLGP